jgi:hypothetical protein
MNFKKQFFSGSMAYMEFKKFLVMIFFFTPMTIFFYVTFKLLHLAARCLPQFSCMTLIVMVLWYNSAIISPRFIDPDLGGPVTPILLPRFGGYLEFQYTNCNSTLI